MIVHHDSVDYFRELPDMLDELLQLLSSEPTSSQIGQILRESRCQLVRLKVQVERLVISFTLDPLQGFAEKASMFVVTRIAANQQNFKA